MRPDHLFQKGQWAGAEWSNGTKEYVEHLDYPKPLDEGCTSTNTLIVLDRNPNHTQSGDNGFGASYKNPDDPSQTLNFVYVDSTGEKICSCNEFQHTEGTDCNAHSVQMELCLYDSLAIERCPVTCDTLSYILKRLLSQASTCAAWQSNLEHSPGMAVTLASGPQHQNNRAKQSLLVFFSAHTSAPHIRHKPEGGGGNTK